MTRVRDYHAEYLRRPYRTRCPRDREKYLDYQRTWHREHWPELHAASVERVRAWRARKARQEAFVPQWLDNSDRFEYVRRCDGLRMEGERHE